MCCTVTIKQKTESLFDGFLCSFNPIQDGGPKSPPTSFLPVTSTNVGIGNQNFLTFSFNPVATLV